jgi:hypothetical protein
VSASTCGRGGAGSPRRVATRRISTSSSHITARRWPLASKRREPGSGRRIAATSSAAGTVVCRAGRARGGGRWRRRARRANARSAMAWRYCRGEAALRGAGARLIARRPPVARVRRDSAMVSEGAPATSGMVAVPRPPGGFALTTGSGMATTARRPRVCPPWRSTAHDLRRWDDAALCGRYTAAPSRRVRCYLSPPLLAGGQALNPSLNERRSA